MSALDLARASIQAAEGFRAHPYSDSLDHLTIGYGTNLDDGITEAQAAALLDVTLDALTVDLPRLIPVATSLDDVRLAVLLEMAYQLGMEGLLEFKSMLAALARGDYAAASLQMKASKWYTQTPTRAARLAEEMATGVPAPTAV